MKRFPILMFHRVEDSRYMNKNGIFLSGEHCSLENFRKHMERLKNEFRVLPLASIVGNIKTGKEIPENSAAITFDDGTRDQIETSLPVLQKFGFPATFFVMSAPLKGIIPPTFKLQLITGDPAKADEIAKGSLPGILEKISPEHHKIYADGIKVPPERFIGEKTETIRQMKYLINYLMPAGLKEEIVNELFSAMFPNETELSRKIFMQPEDLKKLIAENMTIGDHSRTHYNLHTISDEMIESEISESHNDIAAACGIASKLFAFPSGSLTGTYEEKITNLLKINYQAAFTAASQKDWCSEKDNLFALPRVHEKFF